MLIEQMMIDGWEAALYQVIDWLETAAIVMSRVATTTTWKLLFGFWILRFPAARDYCEG